MYDGDHYHLDIDAPGISEPVGPYGETGTGPVNDGGGGYVIFPSRTADPSTGSDFYITDNNNPHLSNPGDSTDHETLSWETIGHGLITHWGVQGRGNDVTSAMTWSGPSAVGGARGVLTNNWLWVR